MEKVIDQVDRFVGKDDSNGMVITFMYRTASDYNSIIHNRRPSHNQKINLNAKFFIRNGNSHFSNHNNFNKIDEIMNQRNNKSYYLASDHEKKKLVNTIIPFNLTLAPNCRIMLLQNFDVAAGLINGSRGTFIQYHKFIDAIKIKFDFQTNDKNPILKQRKKYVEYQFQNGKSIFMYQFPIKLSWAVTAHKSQGQTLSKVAIHIGESAFAHGSFYVSLFISFRILKTLFML